MSHSAYWRIILAIKLIQTGGTIDKQYNVSNGSLYFTKSSLANMLQQGRCTLDIKFHLLNLVDSLEITTDYREQIVAVCESSEEEQIIIAHGTDTMAATAQAIAQTVKNKTIVLFGAMIPFSINYSDALFNLGAAVTAVQCKTRGVYICMNGQVFDADNVIKNLDKGKFEVLK